MARVLVIILIISIIGNIVGLVFAYKYRKGNYQLNQIKQSLDQSRIDYNKVFGKRLVFIHHSVGNNWLSEGSLSDSLMANGIGVHHITYGDDIGEKTDLNDWTVKFSNDFGKIIKFDYHPDILYSDGKENDIVMFKSCYPNSNITADGNPPGNPTELTKTLWNYKAVFENLKTQFSKNPNKIFIYVTAPPLVPNQTTPENAARARQFNNWVKNDFLAKYKQETGLNNLFVFDFYDLLADGNNTLRSEYRRSDNDSHPNIRGSQEATKMFMQFLRENKITNRNLTQFPRGKYPINNTKLRSRFQWRNNEKAKPYHYGVFIGRRNIDGNHGVSAGKKADA